MWSCSYSWIQYMYYSVAFGIEHVSSYAPFPKKIFEQQWRSGAAGKTRRPSHHSMAQYIGPWWPIKEMYLSSRAHRFSSWILMIWLRPTPFSWPLWSNCFNYFACLSLFNLKLWPWTFSLFERCAKKCHCHCCCALWLCPLLMCLPRNRVASTILDFVPEPKYGQSCRWFLCIPVIFERRSLSPKAKTHVALHANWPTPAKTL